MNFIDSFCSNIKKVIALIALMLLLTLVILIFTHTSLGYFLVLLPITLLIIYLLHKIKKLDPENAFIYNSVLVILLFIFILFDLRKDIVLQGYSAAWLLRLYYPSIDGIPSDPEVACQNATAGKK